MDWLQSVDWNFVLVLVLTLALMFALRQRGRDVPVDLFEVWTRESREAFDRLERLADKTRTPTDDALVDLTRAIVPAIEQYLNLGPDGDEDEDDGAQNDVS